MPIYEYECQNCGEEFEKLVFGRAPVSCTKCGAAHVEKLFSVFSASAGTTESQPATNGMEAAGPCGRCGAPREGMCEWD